MGRRLLFLGGDAYPMERQLEEALRDVLANDACRFISHPEIHPGFPDGRPIPIATRLELLEKAVGAIGEQEDIFLIGRSSGGRIATLFAGRNPRVRAVVCICYPFRSPDHTVQPERFTHLASLATPTLVIQGAEDPYGGLELTENYALSQAIRLHFLPGGHEIPPETASGRYVLRHVSDFIAGGWGDGSANLESFDEEFYLRIYPDVANAVAKGRFPSGRHHFCAHGRSEGRKHRLRVEKTE